MNPPRLQPPIHVNSSLRGARCELLPPVRRSRNRRRQARHRLIVWICVMLAAAVTAALAMLRP